MKRDAPRLRRLTTPVVVCALAVAGYGQVLVPDTIPYSPHSDIVAYHLAAKQVLHRSLEAGHGLPFWRGDQLSGTPAFTSPNALYTNPLHFLYFILDPIRATGFTIALLLVAGAYAFYLVGLALRLSAWPRILMAVAGLFSFKLILAVYAGWLGPLCALVTFPLLFASAFFTARNPSARAGLALAGSAALCLHGGQLQVVYYAAWFALAYLVVAGVRLWRQGERPAARRLAAWSAFAGFMAIAMSLYILCPMAAEASLMSRVRASDSFMQSGHALGFRHLLTLFSPEILGTPLDGSYAGVELWEDVAYFGLVPLVLALVGALLGHRRPSVKFLAAVRSVFAPRARLAPGAGGLPCGSWHEPFSLAGADPLSGRVLRHRTGRHRTGGNPGASAPTGRTTAIPGRRSAVAHRRWRRHRERPPLRGYGGTVCGASQSGVGAFPGT